MITGMFVWIAACASPEGVWLFTLGVDPDVPEDCASTVSHNFIDAAEPGEIASDDDSWTSRETTTLSDQAFFGLVTETDTGALLVVDGETYPGVATGAGSWTFSWTGSLAEENEELGAGYGWTVSEVSTELLSYELAFGGDRASGMWGSYTDHEISYAESDTWSEEVAATIGTTGQIPAGSYLVKDDGAGGSYAASNDWSLADCSSNPCTLAVTTSCSLVVAIDAERTDLDPAAYEGVDGAGQDAGL